VLIATILMFGDIIFHGLAAGHWQREFQNRALSCKLRLTAQLRGMWSDRMRRFWMENCLVNLSGKRKPFMPLDMLNEYIVPEVKDKMIIICGTSLLTMFFWATRRKFTGRPTWISSITIDLVLTQ